MKRLSVRNGAPAGFTLVELLVVIAIIGLLAGLALVALGGARGFFRGATAKQRLSDVEAALEIYKTKYGEYPPDSCASNCCLNNPDETKRLKAREIVKRHILKRWPNALKTKKIDEMINTVGHFCGDEPGKALLFWLAGPDGNGFSSDEQFPFGEEPGEGVDANGNPYKYFTCDYGDAESRETPSMELVYDSEGTNGGNYNEKLGVMFQGKTIAYFRAENGDYGLKHFETCGQGCAQPYMKGGAWYNPDSFQLIYPGEDGAFCSHADGDAHEEGEGHDAAHDAHVNAHGVRDLKDPSTITPADRDNIANFTNGATLDAEID
ncbi:MAG: type II secretion system protein [Thermoguttaceae bacterium]|nr:type II secretion system protein [Thermoguttaceae bacterium]